MDREGGRTDDETNYFYAGPSTRNSLLINRLISNLGIRGASGPWSALLPLPLCYDTMSLLCWQWPGEFRSPTADERFRYFEIAV